MSVGSGLLNGAHRADPRLSRDTKLVRLVSQLHRQCRCDTAHRSGWQQRRRGEWQECSPQLRCASGPANGCAAALENDELAGAFDSIPDALAAMAAGEVVVVLDDEARENEGDLVMAADKMTTEAMAFFVEHTSGVVCVAMEGHALDRLALPLMVPSRENEEAMYTAFTVTVDARSGISTGISAADRALTVRLLADPGSRAEDFWRPGHIFPLRYRTGGVLARPGHTEAAVDLARLAGCEPAGVLCEVVNRADGSMARTPQLLAFAREHGLRCVTIAELLKYRRQHDAGQGAGANGAGVPGHAAARPPQLGAVAAA